MALHVVHDEAATTYRLVDDDGEVISHTDYDLSGHADAPVMEFHHTFTVPRHRGNGYAETVVRAALDDARRRSAHVVASGGFVEEFIRDPAEYRELLSDGR